MTEKEQKEVDKIHVEEMEKLARIKLKELADIMPPGCLIIFRSPKEGCTYIVKEISPMESVGTLRYMERKIFQDLEKQQRGETDE